MRGVLRWISTVLIVTGVLLVLDAALMVLWHEPVTAIYVKIRQGQLGDDLNKLSQRPPSAAEARILKLLDTDKARIAFLAPSFRRHVKDGQAVGRIRHIDASYVMVEGTDTAGASRGRS